MSARANIGRVASTRALIAVEQGEHAEAVLADQLPEGTDGRLAWHLTFGVLRHRAQIDAALRPFLRKPIASLDPPVRAVLRVGAFEKLFSRTPDHAAVQQAVEVARRVGARRAVGLVNAVLRRVRPAKHLSRTDALDMPSWLLERWDARYGVDVTTAWCERDHVVPPLCLVTRDLAALDALLAPNTPSARLDGEDLPGTRVVPPGPRPPGVEEGVAWVQDPAAVRVADLLADEVGTGRVLDATASPGGKSLRLWARGLAVTATDLPRRLQRLRDNAQRLDAPITIQPHDWTQPAPGLGTFDGVLLDAPCTGLGTTRRHPEIRWRRHASDLAEAAALQGRLLRQVQHAVRPGGCLVYAVCSPEPEEGSAVVEPFVAEAPFELVRMWSSAPPSGEEDAHQAFVLRKAP